MQKLRLLFASLALLSLGALAACNGSDDDDNQEAHLRVVHASPDAPNVDVFVDGREVLSDVAFLESSGYLHLEPGTRDIEVRVAGTNTTVIDAQLELDAEDAVTVVAGNRVASIAPIVLTDTIEGQQSGSSGIRVLHAAPSAPAVDVYATAPGADLASATPVITNLAFGASSGYLTVPAGNYQVRVTPTGSKNVVIDATITVEGGTNYTAIATDDSGGGAPFGVLLLKDEDNHS